MVCLRFCGRDIADGFEQPDVVEPRHPFHLGKLHRLPRLPRAAPVDRFRLVQPVDRLGQRVVVTVSLASDRWLHARLGHRLRSAHRAERLPPRTGLSRAAASHPFQVPGIRQDAGVPDQQYRLAGVNGCRAVQKPLASRAVLQMDRAASAIRMFPNAAGDILKSISNQLRPAITPPSTSHIAPVTQLASSLRRKAMVFATSSGRPIRPIG